ncbi:MAG: ribose-5-phosphate isomerase RpiA [Desulfobacterales bacterium]|nr:ribose-5-phosphate isomerase RpiA [Desulfobacterales bacterium]
MDALNKLKQAAAYRAVELVKSGMVLGLGTGSTFRFALERLADLLNRKRLENIQGIASSFATEKMAKSLGFPLTTFAIHPKIDLTIDGADEIDPDLNMIKGAGGALLKEKILQQVSRRVVIIADENKLSPRLGTHGPLPVEVIPFACRIEEIFLQSLGASVSLRMDVDGSPYRTDQSNLILDAHFGPISAPKNLAVLLNERAGVVEHGLFLDTTSDVIIAGTKGIKHLRRGVLNLQTNPSKPGHDRTNNH